MCTGPNLVSGRGATAAGSRFRVAWTMCLDGLGPKWRGQGGGPAVGPARSAGGEGASGREHRGGRSESRSPAPCPRPASPTASRSVSGTQPLGASNGGQRRRTRSTGAGDGRASHSGGVRRAPAGARHAIKINQSAPHRQEFSRSNQMFAAVGGGRPSAKPQVAGESGRGSHARILGRRARHLVAGMTRTGVVG